MAEAGYQERKRKSTRQRKKERKRLCILLAIWNLFALIGVITVLWSAVRVLGGCRIITPEDVAPSLSAASKIDGEGGNGFAFAKQESGETDAGRVSVDAAECRKIYQENEELLVLVNKSHALSDTYDPALRNICNGRLQASAVLYDDLSQMLKDAGRQGHSYWISSAYRSRERQQELVDEYSANYRKKGMTSEEALEKTYELTMPAGKSEHQTGLALDIFCSENTNMDVSQAREEGNRWLVEHCHEYGFILRYPKEKEDVTQIDYEPWHFRYVGLERKRPHF